MSFRANPATHHGSPEVFEYTSHKHNYGMVGLLKGERADEQIAMDETARLVPSTALFVFCRANART